MTYDEIKINSVYFFERIISKQDVFAFSELTGDKNRLHLDERCGAGSQFGKNIVHGMLAGGLFSALVGMYCPGDGGLYLSQTLNFRSPIFWDDKVEVRGEVVAKNDSIKVITLKTTISRAGKVAIDGEAKVKLLI